jgi:hypothetical protein
MMAAVVGITSAGLLMLKIILATFVPPFNGSGASAINAAVA